LRSFLKEKSANLTPSQLYTRAFHRVSTHFFNMSLTVYNTLTRQKEIFQPIEPGRVFMYCCGPTVYDHSHIGHGKLYVGMDIVVRWLRFSGYNVRYVMNITDVGHILDTGEDRILKGARRERIEPMEVVERYMRSFLDDMDALKNTRPNIMPRAAAHVPEQIEAIQKLIEKGHAYEVNGSVYFDVYSYPEYGKLSRRKLDELEEGKRVEVRTEKRHAEDFALWKAAEPEHILQWASPWGQGYPGWHIECTAMSTKYLGETFDIHGGGLENIFPHNECELAQSEALTGKPFANYWLHAGSLTLDGVKMSKSLGNSITIKQALLNNSPEVLRHYILSSSYNGPMDYSPAGVESAQKGWERLVSPLASIRQQLRRTDLPQGEISAVVQTCIDTALSDFSAAMDDDFNTPIALSVLFEYTRQVNILLNGETLLNQAELTAILDLYQRLAGDVLGILPEEHGGTQTTSVELTDGLVQLLIEMRANARKNKDYASSDRIRNRLQELGVLLEDGKDGTIYKLSA